MTSEGSTTTPSAEVTDAARTDAVHDAEDGGITGDATGWVGEQPPETLPVPGMEHGDAEADQAETTGDEAASAEGQARPAGGEGGIAAGATAVVSAGLGLVSLAGMPLGGMLRDRAQLSGQIQAQMGGGGNQIDALYGTPWHTTALVDGIVGLVAVVLGAVALAVVARPATARGWARPVAVAGLVLGVLGVLVSAGMYLDLFAAPPQIPHSPMSGGAG